MADRARGRCLGVIATLVVLATAGRAGATEELTGAWRLESPLGDVTGRFLAVRDPDRGAWRLDLGVSDADVRRRRGRGWTFCGDATTGFAQPWDEGWREIGAVTSAFFADLLRAVASPRAPRRRAEIRLAGPPGRRAATTERLVLASWEGLPADWRPPRRVAADAGRLRARLVHRGLGRGGAGLVVRLTRQDGRRELTSARWPGRIELRPRPVRNIGDLPAEAYLPVWPLATFLESGQFE